MTTNIIQINAENATAQERREYGLDTDNANLEGFRKKTEEAELGNGQVKVAKRKKTGPEEKEFGPQDAVSAIIIEADPITGKTELTAEEKKQLMISCLKIL